MEFACYGRCPYFSAEKKSMSAKFDSPIHIQTSVRRLLLRIQTEEKSTMSHEGRMQALVQTEFAFGNVKENEMDCMDSVHSVKSRLLPAFDVPMNRDCNVEILGQLNTCNKVNELVKAIKNALDPVPVNGGLGGAYCFKNSNREPIAIVKPTDEEPLLSGVMRSMRSGETGYREVAAYLLDHDHFAKVPPTVLVKISHPIFNVNSKVASLQQFIPHDFDASDYGTASFPVSAVHRIGILDIRIFNTDRHAGNILVRKLGSKFGEVELTPIDHGFCLPETLEDPYFEWMYWPQASIPFSEIECEYIKNLDPNRDCEMLRFELPMIRETSLRILVLCTIFLKEATCAGLCLAEIGQIMSREYRYPETEPSELELLCMEAKKISLRKEDMLVYPKSQFHHFQIDMEEKHTNNLSPDIKTARYDSMVSPSSVLRSDKELHSMPIGFVNVTDLSHEDWSDFLNSFKKILGHVLANRKSSSIFGPKQRYRLRSSCRF